jgi:hypothetical protein
VWWEEGGVPLSGGVQTMEEGPIGEKTEKGRIFFVLEFLFKFVILFFFVF